MTEHLGKTLSVSGLVLMFNSGASVIGNLFGGSLYDKIGGYKTVMLGTAITLTSLIGLTIWNGFLPYVIFLTIIGFGSGMIFPPMYAMAGNIWKEGGRKAFNAIYVAQNVGVAVGASLGGLVASYSFHLIFLANALMFFVFLVIAIFGYRRIQTLSTDTNRLQEKQEIQNHAKLYALLTLCVGYLLCWVGYTQWQATISAYTQELNISLRQYSLLWTINGALIVLGQPLVNSMLRLFAKSIKKQMIIGMVIFIVSFIVAGQAQAFSGFVAAMVILTIGEMLVWPAVPTIADGLAPKGREGFYQGMVNSTATGGRMVGPLLGGILVDLYGMSMLFNVLVGLIIIAIFTTVIYDHKLKKETSIASTL